MPFSLDVKEEGVRKVRGGGTQALSQKRPRQPSRLLPKTLWHQRCSRPPELEVVGSFHARQRLQHSGLGLLPLWADSPASPLCALGTFLTPGPIPGSPRDQRASLSLDKLSNSSKHAFSSSHSPPFTHFLSYSSSSWFLVISQRNRVPSCEHFTLQPGT